jgi:predicted RNA binding protein YcfA (HicA-like mRNA interferase family)
MSNEFVTMKDLGRLYGLTSHQIGKLLKKLGLRTEQGKPSHAAFKGGYCDQRWSPDNNHYTWAWHAKMTSKILELNGCVRQTEVRKPNEGGKSSEAVQDGPESS